MRNPSITNGCVMQSSLLTVTRHNSVTFLTQRSSGHQHAYWWVEAITNAGAVFKIIVVGTMSVCYHQYCRRQSTTYNGVHPQVQNPFNQQHLIQMSQRGIS